MKIKKWHSENEGQRNKQTALRYWKFLLLLLGGDILIRMMIHTNRNCTLQSSSPSNATTVSLNEENMNIASTIKFVPSQEKEVQQVTIDWLKEMPPVIRESIPIPQKQQQGEPNFSNKIATSTTLNTLPKSQQLTNNSKNKNHKNKNNKAQNIHASHKIQPRAYTPWPTQERKLPCYPAEKDWITMKVQTTPIAAGFMYVKPYKTGSSTSAGIQLRIARNVAQRLLPQNATQQQFHQIQKQKDFTMCRSRYDHGMATQRFQKRIRRRSFLWTIIREPTKRAISSFFHFGVSRQGKQPTDQEFIKYLNVSSSTKSLFQDDYLKTLLIPKLFNRDNDNPIIVSNFIINDYNFIGITERMDESAVVLMMLLNLTIADVLYLSAKKNGGYDDGGGNGCVLIHPTVVSEPVKEFFQTKWWKNIIQYDSMLYQAANRSLDMTIEKLGKEQVHANVEKLKYALQVAEEKCLIKTRFPCDKYGNRRRHNQTDCIWNDSGCGAVCLDEVATELDLW